MCVFGVPMHVFLNVNFCHYLSHSNFRFKDAERELYQGLTQMPNYHKNFSPFFWPGLSGQAIEDLRPHILEVGHFVTMETSTC